MNDKDRWILTAIGVVVSTLIAVGAATVMLGVAFGLGALLT